MNRLGATWCKEAVTVRDDVNSWDLCSTTLEVDSFDNTDLDTT